MRHVVKHGTEAIAIERGRHAVVPDVAGDGEDVALEKLRLSGLRRGPRREARSDAVVSGSVLRTIPRAGTRLARGDRVTIVIAAGHARRDRSTERPPS